MVAKYPLLHRPQGKTVHPHPPGGSCQVTVPIQPQGTILPPYMHISGVTEFAAENEIAKQKTRWCAEIVQVKTQ